MSPSFVSRRTWLWASTTAFAAACARPEPSKLPDGGPEPARPLTRRGAENLTALAELGAAIRWMHPSDQVIETEWEPLLLDGVRGIESAATSVELREGLRGLMVGVAPTLLLWRGGELDEDEKTLDSLACEEPSDEKADAKTPSEASQPATEDRARPAEAVRHHERSGPPSRKAAGAPSDRKQAEDAANAKADAKDDETGGDETTGDETAGDETGGDDETETSSSETGETSEPEPEPEPEPVKAEPAPKPEPAKTEPEATKPEPRPPLPAELFEEGADLEITQWHRRGFGEGLDAQPGCAQRIRRTPTSCGSQDHKKNETACSRCEGESHHALAPGAPAQLDLPRALTAAMPVALWTRASRTLPASPHSRPPPRSMSGERGTTIWQIVALACSRSSAPTRCCAASMPTASTSKSRASCCEPPCVRSPTTTRRSYCKRPSSECWRRSATARPSCTWSSASRRDAGRPSSRCDGSTSASSSVSRCPSTRGPGT